MFRVLTPVLLAQAVTPLSIAGIAVVLPRIASDLGAAEGPLQGVVNAFNVVFAVSTVLSGALADRVGASATFRLGVALTLAGSLLSACAPTLALLDVARGLAGLGAGAVITSATALLSASFDGPARGRAFTLFGSVNGAGLALGPTIAGLIASGVGWRAVFAAHAVALTLALVLSARLPRVARPTPEGPLLDFGLLRRPAFLAMCLVPLAGALGFVTVLTWWPLAIGAMHGLSASTTGLMMLAATVPVLTGPALTGRLVARGTRPMTMIMISLACLPLAALGLWASTGLTGSGAFAVQLTALVVAGAGFGLPLGLVDQMALEAVPRGRTGTAAGVLNLGRIGSEAVFVAGFGWAVTAGLRVRLDPADAATTAAGHPGQPAAYAAAVGPVLGGVALGCLVLGAAVALIEARTKRVAAPTPS